MRNSRRYIFLSMIVGVLFLLKFSNIEIKNEQVKTFRGANLKTEIWNPLIAESVNENEISFIIDQRALAGRENGIYMNTNLSLMLPISILRDSFNCSVHLYQEELIIEKRESQISFELNKDSVQVNKEKVTVTSPMILKDGEYYVPADTVAELLDFSYEWDIEENQAVVINNAAGESILPAKYDLREKKRTPNVKDQGSFGTCWAFAALSAMESKLLPEEEIEFSPDHMSLKNSFYLQQTDGGNYTMGMAYLTAWQGPVYEKQDPYGDKNSPEGLEPVKHVQEIQIIEHKNFQKIKESVFKYGGVQSSIYSAIVSTNIDSDYYNSDTNSYCYIGTEKSNHDVLIIGWDDHYSKENFNMPLEGDGAFICQNSWGDAFGNDGVFYISYYDVNIGSHNLVYTGIEEVDNYDNIYQSDLCGWVGQLGYGRDSIFGANIYRARKNEELVAAGFYALGTDTEYRLYVVNNFQGTDSFAQKKLVAEGKLGNSGYYTIDFAESVPVVAGEKYAIVLQITTPGSEKPLAIEFQADDFTKTVDTQDGESYISASGNSWSNLEKTQESNLCLKVFSNNL